jgi:hypothetical protein
MSARNPSVHAMKLIADLSVFIREDHLGTLPLKSTEKVVYYVKKSNKVDYIC